jgi:multicomponent Na+:H+ antiporter subunit E
MHHLRGAVPLWLVYLALTANLEPSNLLVGLLLALAIAWLLRPERQPLDAARLPAAALAMLRYVATLAVDIPKNGLVVARIVLSPSLPIRPGIIAIPSLARSEMVTALSAHSITLTPGELVVEIGDDGSMFTHVLDIERSDADALAAQQFRIDLLRRIFP